MLSDFHEITLRVILLIHIRLHGVCVKITWRVCDFSDPHKLTRHEECDFADSHKLTCHEESDFAGPC